MARRDGSAKPDIQVQQVLDSLAEYERAHPHAQIEGRRHSPVSIRLRIIDPDFQGLDRLEREPEIWKLLHRLPEDVLVNITMLLLLTPEEAEYSLASQEFDHPIPSHV
jgi:stress-induced morphogen